MSLSRINCDSCGEHDDIIMRINGILVCSTCDGPAELVEYPAGIPNVYLADIAEQSTQLGRTFSNARERNKFMDQKGLVAVPANSPDGKRLREEIRGKAEARVRQQGFNSLEHKGQYDRERRNRG